MKKIIFTLACCLAINSVDAQWSKNFTFGIKGGYEYNIFKTPYSLDEEDDFLIGNDLIRSGFYEGLVFNGQFQNKFENGRFKVNFRSSANNYHTEENTNLYDFGLSSSYRVKYAKRKYFELSPAFYRRQRAGQDLSDDILRTTLSYTQFILPLSFDFYLKDKTWLKTDLGYRLKSYDENDMGEKVSYHAFFAGISFSKKWQNDQKIRKLILSPGIEYRAYTDLEAQNEEGEESDLIEDDRDWTYTTANVEYNVKLAERPLSYTIGLYSTFRHDVENKFGYKEFGPGVRLNLPLNKASMSIGGSFRHRTFNTLKVNESADVLIYQYLRANARLTVPIGKNSTWYVEGNVIRRLSNNSNQTSTAFRSYNYALVSTGLTFRF